MSRRAGSFGTLAVKPQVDSSRNDSIARGAVPAALRDARTDLIAPAQAELALRERLALQEQIAATAESVPGMIYSLQMRPDGSSRMPYVSGALLEIFDLQPSDVIDDASPIFSLVHPDDIANVLATITESARTMLHWRDEFRVCRTRLGEIWVEGHSVPKREQDGSVLWHGFIQDITERKRSQQAIERALQRLNEAQRIAQMGDWEYDIATQAIAWSPQVFAILGRDPALGPPGNLEEQAEVYDPPSRALLARKVARAIASGESQSFELQAQRPGGRQVQVRAVAMPRKDARGRVLGLHGTIQDVSVQKRAEQAVLARAHRELLVATLGRFAVSNTDLEHVFVEAASSAADGLGVEFSEVILFDATDGSLLLKAGIGWQLGWVGRRMARPTGRSQVAFVLRSKEPVIVDDFRNEPRFNPSEMLEAHAVVSGISVPIGSAEKPLGVVGAYARDSHQFSSADVAFLQSIANTLSTAIERKRADQQLAYMTQHDALTGLPNRLLLTDRLDAALVQAQRSDKCLALMLLNVDRFKSVNDAFGHELGDIVLREVAARLASCVQAEDTVSRQGGDEFLIVLPDIDTGKRASQVAQDILAALAAPFRIGGTELVLSASLGIACFPEGGRDSETLLRNADAAMYVAKDTGRSRFQFYSPEMNASAAERQALESDLRRAIEHRQLFLMYQPQVNLGTRAVVGLEALVRWRHPTSGVVSPGQFIPIAEEAGLIVAIGTWVLEAACGQQARWVAQGLVMGTVAVNVSAHQFRQPDFVDVVAATLSRARLPATFLELEVTESVVMQGLDDVLRKLHKLHQMGIKLAIDDFGTGYSSLSYLKQFPIDRLKIDQSFVRSLTEDNEGSAIARAIISMGHSLGLNVLAEGIETAVQEDRLRSLSCDAGQGFYYAMPMLPDECGEYLHAHARLGDMATSAAAT